MTASYERGEQSMELNSCCTGDTVNAELLNLGSRLSGGSVTDGMLWPCYLPESHPPRSVLMCCKGTPGNFLKTPPGVPQVCHTCSLANVLPSFCLHLWEYWMFPLEYLFPVLWCQFSECWKSIFFISNTCGMTKFLPSLPPMTFSSYCQQEIPQMFSLHTLQKTMSQWENPNLQWELLSPFLTPDPRQFGSFGIKDVGGFEKNFMPRI